MLRIWRRLRRKLIDEGNLKRYLIYAFGEIFLVMIGILLAVQVNNLYEKSKTISKQNEYLKLVRSEMINNQKNLSIEKGQLENSVIGQRKLIDQIDSLKAYFNEQDFSTNWSAAFSGEIRCPIEKSAISELKYSGVLKDIRNDSIKNFLASWEGRLERMRYQEQGLRESRKKCNNYLEQNGDFRTIINLKAFKRLGINKSSEITSNKEILNSQ